VSGTPLQVYEWGAVDAPAVVYWDGLGGGGLHANELAPPLVRKWGRRVIAPDPPGHGKSPPRAPESFRPSAQAALTADLLSLLGAWRAAFVGFSRGAEVGCAFAALYPERTTALVLIDGAYWDFADLPDHDPAGSDLSFYVERARASSADDRFASWRDYFAAEESGLLRWSPNLEDAHRAFMREEDGWIVPIITPEVVGAIHHGNTVEPSAELHPSLRASGVPILLMTPADGKGPVSLGGIERFKKQVPQLEVKELPGKIHDLVSHAPEEVATLIGNWLTGETWFPRDQKK